MAWSVLRNEQWVFRRLCVAALLGCLSMGLIGCGPPTMARLREQPSASYVFVVERKYEDVYRVVLANARQCHQGGLITAQMVVQGDQYPDINRAEVVVALHGAAGVSTYMGVDISALGAEGGTEVRVYSGLGTWNKFARAIKSWVIDGTSSCTAPVQGG